MTQWRDAGQQHIITCHRFTFSLLLICQQRVGLVQQKRYARLHIHPLKSMILSLLLYMDRLTGASCHKGFCLSNTLSLHTHPHTFSISQTSSALYPNPIWNMNGFVCQVKIMKSVSCDKPYSRYMCTVQISSDKAKTQRLLLSSSCLCPSALCKCICQRLCSVARASSDDLWSAAHDWKKVTHIMLSFAHEKQAAFDLILHCLPM